MKHKKNKEPAAFYPAKHWSPGYQEVIKTGPGPGRFLPLLPPPRPAIPRGPSPGPAREHLESRETGGSGGCDV